MKVIDIDCIVRNMMNTIEGKPSIKIKVMLYSDGILKLDNTIDRIRYNLRICRK